MLFSIHDGNVIGFPIGGLVRLKLTLYLSEAPNLTENDDRWAYM